MIESKGIQKDHFVIELFGLDPNILNKQPLLFKKLDQFSAKLQLTVVNRFFHTFNPLGLTCVYVLAESHLAVHTWPERGYLHIDLFTCSSQTDFLKVKRYIKEIFRTKNYKLKRINY